MAEYIDREALVAQIKPPQADDDTSAVLMRDARKIMRDFVLSVPAADVVEVVRCRDCRYGRVVRCGDTEVIDCAFEDDEYLHERLPTDFCSYGERKEDG